MRNHKIQFLTPKLHLAFTSGTTLRKPVLTCPRDSQKALHCSSCRHLVSCIRDDNVALMSLITMLLVHRRGECGCGLFSLALKALTEFTGFFWTAPLFGETLGDGTVLQFSVVELCCWWGCSPSTNWHCCTSDLSVVLVTLLQPGDRTIPAGAGVSSGCSTALACAPPTGWPAGMAGCTA